MSQKSCICQKNFKNFDSLSFDEILETIFKIREQCQIIKNVIIPDKKTYEKAVINLVSDKTYFHESMISLALRRSLLDKFMTPLHHFIPTVQLLEDLNQNYKKDLIETNWLREKNQKKRLKQYKIYMGKLIEFHVAEWLNNNGYVVEKMAAFGNPHDISVLNNLGKRIDIEVKYVGSDNKELTDSMLGRVYQSKHHFLRRLITQKINEGFNQLQKSPNKKMVIIVLNSREEEKHRMIQMTNPLGFNGSVRILILKDWQLYEI